MEIRLRSTGEVLYEGEFRTRFAQNLPSTPLTQEWLNTYNTDPAGDIVLEGPQPTPSRYQIMVRDGVTNVNGQWFTFYKLVDLDAEGIAAKDAEQAKNVRATRDQKLADLDWTQGKDIPDAVSNPAAVTRQALRDLPAQAGFPWEVVWPDAE